MLADSFRRTWGDVWGSILARSLSFRLRCAVKRAYFFFIPIHTSWNFGNLEIRVLNKYLSSSRPLNLLVSSLCRFFYFVLRSLLISLNIALKYE